MTAQEVKSIIYRWQTTIDMSLSDMRNMNDDQSRELKAQKIYALGIIKNILTDIQKKEKQQ